MPIEIRELQIKAVIGDKEKEYSLHLKPEELNKLKKEITKDVMEKILRTLRQKNER